MIIMARSTVINSSKLGFSVQLCLVCRFLEKKEGHESIDESFSNHFDIITSKVDGTVTIVWARFSYR